MFNRAFLRVKYIQLGYSMPKVAKRIKANNLRVYANGYNLLTFTSFKANDPEAQAGFGSTRYPMTRVYNFGFNITF
jgi:hypothetical protein